MVNDAIRATIFGMKLPAPWHLALGATGDFMQSTERGESLALILRGDVNDDSIRLLQP